MSTFCLEPHPYRNSELAELGLHQGRRAEAFCNMPAETLDGKRIGNFLKLEVLSFLVSLYTHPRKGSPLALVLGTAGSVWSCLELP